MTNQKRSLKLNTLAPKPGAKRAKKRVGRGAGSGIGKTCGSGHKGQKSRSGGGVRIGFEGGQMPLKQRVPKFGFVSRKSLVCESLRLSDLNKIKEGDIVDLKSLQSSGLIKQNTKQVKIYLFGELKKALTVRGIRVSKGAKAAIASAGGTVEELSS